MPRGQPDYGQYATRTTGATLADLGEAVVRLGSIVTYDRRGLVVDFDDFEEPAIRWNVDRSLPANIARHIQINARSGSQSIYIWSFAGAGEHTFIHKSVPVLGVNRIGAEVSFAGPSLDALVYIKLTYYDGTNRHEAQLMLERRVLELYIWDTTGWVKIADTGGIFTIAHSFHTFKLVVDFNYDEYVRVLFNQNEYDVSAYSVPTALDGIAPSVKVEIGVENSPIAIAGQAAYFDNYILTQDEP